MVKKPNFLIFLPDQHRGDWMPYDNDIFQKMGMNKLPLRMPEIRKIMDRGVTFTNAITSSPLCAPARACLASGKRYKDCGVAGNHINYPLDQMTYYSVLKAQGYIVASVGKLDLHKPSLNWGLDGWLPELEKMGFTNAIDNEGKWDAILSIKKKQEDYSPKGPYMKYLADNNYLVTHVEDFMKRFKKYNTEPTPLPDEAYCDNWITRNGIEMLRKFPKEKPWHLVVNFTNPHDPWDITEKMKQDWQNVEFPPPFDGNRRKEIEEIKIRQNYAAKLENIDMNIGRILEEVKKRGELENTIVIYTSDHGEMLGDFNKHGKQLPQRGSTHIPLVIAGPSIDQDLYNDQLVELQDLTATILDYAGTKMEEAKDSISLRKLLEGKEEHHRLYQISALNLMDEIGFGWKLIRDKNYKLVVEKDMIFKLYNIILDPWENNDISEQQPEIVKRLLEELNLVYEKLLKTS